MRYSPELYARSLYESLEAAGNGDRERLFKNFWQTIKKNGDESRIESIIRSFEKMVVRRSGGRMIEVESARTMPAPLLEKVQKLFGGKDVVKKKINSKLVAGVRIEVNGEQEIDFSLATKLRKMFSKTA